MQKRAILQSTDEHGTDFTRTKSLKFRGFFCKSFQNLVHDQPVLYMAANQAPDNSSMVFRKYRLVLPDLTSEDEIVLYDSDDGAEGGDECALTLDPIGKSNPVELLREHVPPEDTALQSLVDKACQRPLPRGVRVARCGHRFCAIPFLMHILRTKFCCPVCRGGSGELVNLNSKAKRMQPDLWHVLSMVCGDARRRAQREEEEEARLQVRLCNVNAFAEQNFYVGQRAMIFSGFGIQ